MQTAISQFSELLGEEDQCAVVCVLGHSENGSLFGRDGVRVRPCDLLRPMNSSNCVQMAGKPKIVVLQTCDGVRTVYYYIDYNNTYYIIDILII